MARLRQQPGGARLISSSSNSDLVCAATTKDNVSTKKHEMSRSKSSPSESNVSEEGSTTVSNMQLLLSPSTLVPKRQTPSTALKRQVRLPTYSPAPISTFEILPRNERLKQSTPRHRLLSRTLTRLSTFEDPSMLETSNEECTSQELDDANGAPQPEDEAGDSSSDEEDLPSPSTGFRSQKPTWERPSREAAKLPSRDTPRALQPIHLNLIGSKAAQTDSSQDATLSILLPDDREELDSDKENEDAVISFSPSKLRKSKPVERPATPPLQASPSKSRLQSPSKRVERIPNAAARPSLDTFWSADAVNDWNDQHSPQKLLKSPGKSKLPSKCSPCKLASPSKEEAKLRQQFQATKHALAEEFLKELDQKITSGKIAEMTANTGGVKVVWSKFLSTTAGRANWRRERTKSNGEDPASTAADKTIMDFASIELAEKIISEETRLLNVLAHEFCHLANFMISGVRDRPHGAEFKRWGRLCTDVFADRGVNVTTKHTYEIDYKYIWRCSNGDCEAEFKRHSKSIDPSRHTCGTCKSRLMQIKPAPRKQVAADGGYASYVKKHFADVRASLPAGTSQKDVMTAIGQKYRAEKEARLQENVAETNSPASIPESVEDPVDDGFGSMLEGLGNMQLDGSQELPDGVAAATS